MTTKNLRNHLFFVSALFYCLFANAQVNDNHITVYSTINYHPLPDVSLTPYKSPQGRPGQDSNLAVGVSISGGGSRAQYFGIGALIALDDIKNANNSFLHEIDYFSTVSGGGFAGGYFLSLQKNGILQHYQDFMDYWKSPLHNSVLQEYLWKNASVISVLNLPLYERNERRPFYPDLINRELLQATKQYNNALIKDIYLSDIFIPFDSAAPVTLPMYVANGTVYHNAERFPFMPHIIASLGINGSLLPEKPFKNADGYTMPFCYAIAGSAAFPGILPMIKFSLNNNDSVVRIIDGGVVDNLGFTTLFELLHADKCKDENKKALIIDCSGMGVDGQKQDDGIVKLASLVAKALLFTVDVNLATSTRLIDMMGRGYNISSGHIERIGFSTIKEKFWSVYYAAPDALRREADGLTNRINNKSITWTGVYLEFVTPYNSSGYTSKNISELPEQVFGSFTPKQILSLFELSSQVDTRIEVSEFEKQILVLAGRYAVFCKTNELHAFIQ